MQHKSVSAFAFWMCGECDSVWVNLEDAKSGGVNRITLASLYGVHGWSLIEEGFIEQTSKREQADAGNA